MSLLTQISNWFKPRRKIEAAGSPLDTLQRTDHAEYWAYASSGSADAVISPQYRRTVWNRARMELTNSCWLSGMVDTYVSDLLGRGPRIQIIPDEVSDGSLKAANRVEELWQEHTAEIKFSQKLRTQIYSRVTDGEGLAVLETDPSLGTPVKLDYAIYEADYFGDPWSGANLGRINMSNVYDGIRLNRRNQPLTYFRFREHPGAYLRPGWSAEYDEIPAEYVVHIFKQKRPGQHRGLSELLPALDLMVDLRRYRDAAVKAARRAASMSALIKSNMEPGEADEITDGPFSQIPMPIDALMNLPDGWDALQLKAEHPTQTYGDFTWAIMQEVARCLARPVAVATGDSSKMNYASGRLDRQASDRLDSVDRDVVEQTAIRPTFNEWYREGRLIRNFLPRIGGFKVRVHWDGRPHVDPAKEANAAEKLASAGLLDEERYWSEVYGLGLDEAYAMQKRVADARQRAGLPPRESRSTSQPVKRKRPQGAANG